MTTPCTQQDRLDEIKNDVKSILKLLNGNGKIGFIAKCQMTYDYMIAKRKDNHDIVVHAYRIVVGIALAFIAIKLGMK